MRVRFIGVLLITAQVLLDRTFAPAIALQVTPESNCSSSCSGHRAASSTTSADIACHDGDYNTTSTGIAFRDCVACELESRASNSSTGQSDLGSALCA